MINVSRFCSTLATLMSSGVPILTAMNIVKNIIANVHMAKAVEEARVLVKEGGSMATPLKASGYYPTMVTHMITLGEKSGELEPMLKIVSDNYEDQVNNITLPVELDVDGDTGMEITAGLGLNLVFIHLSADASFGARTAFAINAAFGL